MYAPLLYANIANNLILFVHVNLLFAFGWSTVLLFGQDARSSKSNFIGCFDPNCHVISVVEGMYGEVFLFRSWGRAAQVWKVGSYL